jgi:ribosome-binding protein aMBF1 (putative translation factor)
MTDDNSASPRGQRDTAYVYVIGADEGPFKVGITNGHPRHRLAALQTAHHQHLNLVAHVAVPAFSARKIERAVHGQLRRSRAAGEWFRVTAQEATAAVEEAAGQTRERAHEQPSLFGAAVSGAQLRAARALLGWSAETLATKARVSVAAVHRAEEADLAGYVTGAAELQRTMQAAGVAFTPGSGVALTCSSGIPRRLRQSVVR